MNVVVKSPFRDLYNFDKVYSVGDVIDVADERAAKLKKLGLVENGKEKEKAVEKEHEKEKEPEKETEPTADFFAQTTEPPKYSRKRKE